MFKQQRINYGYIYLSLIPIFAVIYTALPAGYIDYGSLPDNFWTNLYYSAVTVTTLGYGDITPCNEYAALVMAAEAVMGVVLIGLFLNQIAYKQSLLEKAREQELKATRARFQECDRLLQFASVIKRIEDKDELDEAVRDFVLSIDMHDWRVLERICILFITDGDVNKFKERFKKELLRIEEEYRELRAKTDGQYWG